MPSASFLSYWYLQLPSLLLAVFIYLLLVRLVAEPVLGADTAVMRVLAAVTNPVVKTVRAITPRVVPATLVLAFAIVWLLTLRILLHQLFLARRMFG